MTIEHQIEACATMSRLDELEAALASLKEETSGQALTGADKDTAHVLNEAIKLRRVYERVQGLLP